jgi:hypothetical protein
VFKVALALEISGALLTLKAVGRRCGSFERGHAEFLWEVWLHRGQGRSDGR